MFQKMALPHVYMEEIKGFCVFMAYDERKTPPKNLGGVRLFTR
jgi:hypothetical protein